MWTVSKPYMGKVKQLILATVMPMIMEVMAMHMRDMDTAMGDMDTVTVERAKNQDLLNARK